MVLYGYHDRFKEPPLWPVVKTMTTTRWPDGDPAGEASRACEATPAGHKLELRRAAFPRRQFPSRG